MRNIQFTRLVSLLVAAAAGFAPSLLAGPVPGVESISKSDVDFQTPPSITAFQTSDGDFLVTFRYRPEEAVTSVSVVGDFNHWSKDDLPMEQGSDGSYSVTARMPSGQYNYKFVIDNDAYIPDPENPNRTPDQYENTIVKLGIAAFLDGITVAKGDGEILSKGFAHLPQEYAYFDVLSEEEAIIRFRTVRDDVESVRIVTLARDGQEIAKTMILVGGDDMFDFWEYHLDLNHYSGTVVAYRFDAVDGSTVKGSDRVWPLVLNPAAIVHTPEWAQNAIWYQVMIDRFRDGDPSNNPEQTVDGYRIDTTHPWTSEWYEEQPYERRDGKTFWEWSMYNRLYGGDFQGLIEKLDYIQSLGVTAIYLNPVFEAPSSHKYDGRSFTHADDGYGVPGEFAKSTAKEDYFDSSTWEFNESDQLLLKLIEEVKKRDMRIIFDGVFNHLGQAAVPFLDVEENLQDSKFADWYTITSWDPFEYVGWAGFAGLPEFQKTETGLVSDTLTKYIHEVTARWLDPNGDGDPSDGIDGWRLDVPNELPREFWREWRKTVKGVNKDALIIGEIWDPAEYWLDGTTFDGVMNYEFSRTVFDFFGDDRDKIDVSEFDRRLGRLRIRYPRASTYVLQNLHDSHDTDRWVSRLMNPDLMYDGENRIQDSNPDYFDERPDDLAYTKLRLMALFQTAYVGAPMIWYGTEVGMYGADDPMCRMPMWWEDLMPYDNADYIIMDDLREFFREMFALRNKYEVLRTGSFKSLLADDDKDVYAFLRYLPGDEDAVAVVVNNSDQEQEVIVPLGVKPELVWGESLPVDRPEPSRGDHHVVKLAPYSGLVYEVRYRAGQSR